MAMEITNGGPDWSRLQGTVLEGGYELEDLVAADGEQAEFRVRVLGDGGRKAFARFYAMSGLSAADASAEALSAADQVAVWQELRGIASANLAAPMGAGQSEIDGASAIYVVEERPDETLDGVLRERALDREEAGDILVAMARALGALHANGFVHGCVSPEHILAIGDKVQLSSECVHRTNTRSVLPNLRAKYTAPESPDANVTTAADVWCLGATLAEILTQRPCEADCLERAAALPPPFNSVAQRCLDPDPGARVEASQVEALFRARGPVPPAAAALEKPAPLAPAVAPVAAAAERPISQRATLPTRDRVAPPPHEHSTAPTRQTWLYVAAGVVLLVAAIWAIGSMRHRPATARTVNSAAAPGPGKPTAWPSRTLAPEDAKSISQPRSRPAASPAKSIPPAKTDVAHSAVWRVVLYTYSRAAEAEAKAHWVNGRYPSLQASTFSPSGGSPYLVVAGGRMTRDEANRLRQRARSMGLPRDCYIQNYAR